MSGDLVAPVVERLAERVRGAFIVRTDADRAHGARPNSPEHVQRGAIWAVIGDDRDVLFRYTQTGEGASGPWAFLAGRTGYLQADASNVFDRLFNGHAASAVELGCWSHARRYLVALEGTDCRVAYPLKLVARLYRIEHLADASDLTPEGRRDLRQQRAAPVLQKLKRWCVATRQTEPPSTDLARAAGYAVNHWTALTRFLEDGRISLDNNLTERQLRDIALGRKNYLFAGSHDASRRAAPPSTACFAPVPSTTCRRYRISPTCSASWPRAGCRAASTSYYPTAGRRSTVNRSSSRLRPQTHPDSQQPPCVHTWCSRRARAKPDRVPLGIAVAPHW